MDEFDWMQMREEASNYVRNKNTKILNNWCAEAHVTSPIGYYNDYETLTVFTDSPGKLIGKAGTLIEKYKAEFNEEFHGDYKIKFVEIRGGFANIA